MKTLKSVFVLSLLFFSTLAYGQIPPRNPGEGQQGPPSLSEKQIDKLIKNASENLKLDPVKSKQLEQTLKKHFEEVKNVSEKYKKSHQAEKAEMDSLKTVLDRELAEFLTTDQQKLLERMMRRPMRPEPPKRKGQGRPAK